MDLCDSLVSELYIFLTKDTNSFKGAIIKRHTEHLNKLGEFSFPWKIEPWKHYINNDNNCWNSAKTIFDVAYPKDEFVSLENSADRLVEKSAEWSLKFHKCDVKGDRIHIFLDRISTLRLCLQKLSALPTDNAARKELSITMDNESGPDLSCMRLKLLKDVSINLAKLNKFNVICDTNTAITAVNKIHLTLKSPSCDNFGGKILCAPVLNNKTGLKEQSVTTEDYLRKRTTDMQLVAQHKYGLKITNENNFKTFLEKIGMAAVKFDLLQIRPSHSVLISLTDNGSGCSKGASFVLYNCARLSSIINTFKDNVKKGIYPPLPNLCDIDLRHLNDEDEWTLAFSYILNYPALIKQCLRYDGCKYTISPHHVCSFLSAMVGKFSMYYRRVRVLLEARDHLLPVVFARIHLITSIQMVLHNALSILDIEPVTQM